MPLQDRELFNGTTAVRVMGFPAVDVAGEQLRFRNKKVMALVVYLAVTGRPHTREHLAALLWPEVAPDRANGSLRAALSRARKPFAEQGVDPFAIEANWIGIVEGAVSVPELSEMFSGGDEDDTGRSVLDLSPVTFLAGFEIDDADPFGEWVAAQRLLVDQAVDAAADRLTRHHLRRNEVDAARERAAQWIERRPGAERAHLALLESLAARGDRAAVVDAFEHYVTVMSEAYGAGPSDAALAVVQRARSDRSLRGPAAAWQANERAPRLPLVGRGDSFAQLVEAHELAAGGHPQVVPSGCVDVPEGKGSEHPGFHGWILRCRNRHHTRGACCCR